MRDSKNAAMAGTDDPPERTRHAPCRPASPPPAGGGRRTGRRGRQPHPRRAARARRRPRGDRHAAHRPPWFPLDMATIPDRTRALQAALDAAGINLKLHPGGEIYPAGATGLTRPSSRSSPRARPGRAGSCSRCRSRASTRRTWPPARTSARRLRPADRAPGARDRLPPRRPRAAAGGDRRRRAAPGQRLLAARPAGREALAGARIWSATGTPPCSPPTATAAPARTRSRPARPPPEGRRLGRARRRLTGTTRGCCSQQRDPGAGADARSPPSGVRGVERRAPAPTAQRRPSRPGCSGASRPPVRAARPSARRRWPTGSRCPTPAASPAATP